MHGLKNGLTFEKLLQLTRTYGFVRLRCDVAEEQMQRSPRREPHVTAASSAHDAEERGDQEWAESTAEPTANGEQPPSTSEDKEKDSPAREPSLCACHASATMQLPQVVYVLVPVQLGSAQPSLVPNATVLAAGSLSAAQVQQVMLPVSQVAYSSVPSPSSVCETPR
ncbi:hypothetical protein PHYPSEUDO_008504 [Phytophthora pseudosyringae]|uniref:Uncharacterized protein n=1 Tax=Phytophthora pseudosyringae TaxID=221518 RepID=A0A8T1VDY4_9STRA|nr:hypothetical protein PHYPSEUDO_008504 [Phytophthora pseudosyringae]